MSERVLKANRVPHITLSAAAKLMGIAHARNARARLQRLEKSSGEQILHWTGTRWQVNPAALERAQTDRREDLGSLERRVVRLEMRVRKLAAKKT